MLSDLNRVDLKTVHEQSRWVCGCGYQQVERLEREFKRTLQEQNGLGT